MEGRIMKKAIVLGLFLLGILTLPFSDAVAGKEEDMLDEISSQISAGNCNADLCDSLSFMASASRDARDISDAESQSSFWDALSVSIEGACGSAELNANGCSALQAKL